MFGFAAVFICIVFPLFLEHTTDECINAVCKYKRLMLSIQNCSRTEAEQKQGKKTRTKENKMF